MSVIEVTLFKLEDNGESDDLDFWHNKVKISPLSVQFQKANIWKVMEALTQKKMKTKTISF